MPWKIIKTLWYWLARWVCRLFFAFFFKLRVYGKENIPGKGPFLLVSNHQSYLDPVLCGVAIERHLQYLARDSLFANRFFKILISSLNAIPVRREEADLKAMKSVIEKLKHNWGVTLFPEATRTSDGRISPLKAGFGLLAKRAQASVIPMVIDGAFEAWPRDQSLFSTGGMIIITYGKPISYQLIKDMDERELASRITGYLREIQNKSRLKHRKKTYEY